MPLRALLVFTLLASLTGCARISESFNQFQRTWDSSAKTVTVYSLDGKAVRTYDIGRSKVTRAEAAGDYIYFYSEGKYVQTNMPYIAESK